MELVSHPGVVEKFAAYPESVREKMNVLRTLVLEAAAEIDGLEKLEESLKWGEPSYIAKKGSTLRMDWKARSPEQYALYFKCTSKLVPTFRVLYGDRLRFENNRAILLKLDESLPVDLLKDCIKMALTYHSIKHLPLLGA